MPMIRFHCSDSGCGIFFSKMYKNSIDLPSALGCKKCGASAKRTLSSPASSSKITVDNGVQARAVEIDPNIEEINSERARKPADRGD
jgi:hypothetical protein